MASRARRLGIEFDTSALDGLSSDLAAFAGDALQNLKALTTAAVGERAREEAIDSTFRYLNLPRRAIADRIDPPTTDKAGRTSVRAPVRGMTLQNFGVIQQTVAVRWSNERIQSMGLEFGTWPGWTKRTGDSYAGRNIAPDFKAAGVSVQIFRGRAPTRFKHGFLMGIRSGKQSGGSGVGVFSGKGSPEHHYGPSPYQTFRYYINSKAAEIADDLQAEFLRNLDDHLKRTIL